MGDRGLDSRDAGAYDSFEWGSFYGTEINENQCIVFTEEKINGSNRYTAVID